MSFGEAESQSFRIRNRHSETSKESRFQRDHLGTDLTSIT